MQNFPLRKIPCPEPPGCTSQVVKGPLASLVQFALSSWFLFKQDAEWPHPHDSGYFFCFRLNPTPEAGHCSVAKPSTPGAGQRPKKVCIPTVSLQFRGPFPNFIFSREKFFQFRWVGGWVVWGLPGPQIISSPLGFLGNGQARSWGFCGVRFHPLTEPSTTVVDVPKRLQANALSFGLSLLPSSLTEVFSEKIYFPDQPDFAGQQ